MAINKHAQSQSIIDKVKANPGPYIGYIKSATDVNRNGRLFVFIPDLHGNFDPRKRNFYDQAIAVNYCSPFAGQTPLSETATALPQYKFTQKSYGFWMVPPDIDTKVLVMFANGQINQGYWIGCIPEENMNQMVPGIASGQKFVGSKEEEKKYKDELGLTNVPTTEAQRRAKVNPIVTNTNPREDKVNTIKPIHVPMTETLVNQGLAKDDTRGLTSSSARRETPSQVFGISTPGPIDFEGQQVFEKRESINRHGKIYDDAGDEFAWKKAAHSRLGGHQFVMDDGTPVKREGTKDVGTIENELIRLRTRSGAQILLHNSESLVYITNSSGTAWIEFTADGKIDIHADDSVSIHTNSDINMRAERDINMEAGRNVNVKAIGNNENEIKNSDPSLTSGRLHLDGVNIEMYAHKDTDDAGGDIKIKAENDHSLYATNNFHVEAGADVKVYATANGLIETGTNFKMYGTSSISLDSGGDVNFNSGIVSANVVGASLAEVIAQLDTYDNERIPNGSETEPDPKSIVKRLPTREPYANHENKRQKFATAEMTDRERPDKRKEEE